MVFIYAMLGEKGEPATGWLANGISGKQKAGVRSAWNCPDFQLETSTVTKLHSGEDLVLAELTPRY